jgi:hypothetical protein
MIAIVFTDDCPSRGQAETNPAFDAVAGGFEPDGAMAGRGWAASNVSTMTPTRKRRPCRGEDDPVQLAEVPRLVEWSPHR